LHARQMFTLIEDINQSDFSKRLIKSFSVLKNRFGNDLNL